MGKKSFYTELIEELVQEEVGPDKETRRQVLMNKFNVAAQKTEKKVSEVNTKDILLNSVRALGGFSPQFDVIVQKISENHILLQNEHSGAWNKLILACRKVFGLTEKSIEYRIKVIQPLSQIEKSEQLDYSTFIDSLTHRSRLYAAVSVKTSSAYQKIEEQSDDAILEYVQRKINECQSLCVTLVGLDEFFKTEVAAEKRTKVKGLSMELTSIKNTLVKVNQRKAEYVSLLAEQEQMKKLGITDE